MAALVDAPTWAKANPGKTQQDYYSWMYQPQQYAQKLGATAAEAGAFDPNASALDIKNAAANTALVGRVHSERQAGAATPQRQAVYQQRMQVYGQNQAKAPGFAGVSPGVQAPGGGMSAAPAPAAAASPAGPAAGARPGFAGVQPMQGAGGRRGLRTSFGAAAR